MWERGRVVDGAEKGVIEIELANGSIPGRKREVREKEGEVEGGRASRQHDGNRGW